MAFVGLFGLGFRFFWSLCIIQESNAALAFCRSVPLSQKKRYEDLVWNQAENEVIPRGAEVGMQLPASLAVPKARWDRTCSSLGQWNVSLPMAGVGTGWSLKSLPPPGSGILWIQPRSSPSTVFQLSPLPAPLSTQLLASRSHHIAAHHAGKHSAFYWLLICCFLILLTVSFFLAKGRKKPLIYLFWNVQKHAQLCQVVS